ncbi:MAG: bifunctional (p)ppGpp synthetase/guanosine-3',5'-bis(diphosphate) 3'-pyrophosphohydrolase [Acidobacteriia bacterium]|nr:bifunctional (p)ppGpp synthetase/guanosine-3',5'-bis(diphosphate) 3'-pyrophosphohydrolase [Terriglobia bacterium]
MIRFEDLAEKVLRYHPEALEMIQRGYVASAKFHKGQLRMNGEPYLTHPLEVANILAELKLDSVTVTAGLLHDVLEDTLMSPEELRKQFGEEVYQIVDGVTKISQVYFSSRHEKQAENFRKMLLAMVGDIRVLFVKLADRLHNMRTLQYLPPDRRERISLETLDIYAPLAHRLGMARIRGELEDLSFSFLDPVAYQNTVSLIEARRAVSQDFIEETKKAIATELAEYNIPARLESRIKRIYGVYNKMRRQKIGIDEVFDFIAIRVITDTVKNCYTILGILHNLWKPVPGRIKDYIAIPRPNLYQSLHTSVIGKNGQPFEIQIRTQEMHRIAELGIAAHWKYKEGKSGAVEGEEQFRWLRQLIDSQSEISDPREFISSLKVDLYPDEVYCFTPMGEVITLPREATPVDFAYAIHTEVGHHCVGAKVNSRIVPLRHKLKNGEIVEILTTKDAGPNRDWLSFVKTSRARNRIKHWVNQKEREDAAELGKKLLEKQARKFKTNWKKVLTMAEFPRVLTDHGIQRVEELYPAVGFGKIAPRQIFTILFPDLAPPLEVNAKRSAIATVVKKVLGRGETPITVKGQDGLLVYRAKCCNPIRGDEIVGYITRGKGISVHTTNCPNLGNFLGSDRMTDVEWVDVPGEEIFTVRLAMTIEDRQGILAEITSAVSNLKTNIKESRSTTTEGGRGTVDLTVEINDVRHLQKIIKVLKTIRGIEDVARVSRIP